MREKNLKIVRNADTPTKLAASGFVLLGTIASICSIKLFKTKLLSYKNSNFKDACKVLFYGGLSYESFKLGEEFHCRSFQLLEEHSHRKPCDIPYLTDEYKHKLAASLIKSEVTFILGSAITLPLGSYAFAGLTLSYIASVEVFQQTEPDSWKIIGENNDI